MCKLHLTDWEYNYFWDKLWLVIRQQRRDSFLPPIYNHHDFDGLHLCTDLLSGTSSLLGATIRAPPPIQMLEGGHGSSLIRSVKPEHNSGSSGLKINLLSSSSRLTRCFRVCARECAHALLCVSLCVCVCFHVCVFIIDFYWILSFVFLLIHNPPRICGTPYMTSI